MKRTTGRHKDRATLVELAELTGRRVMPAHNTTTPARQALICSTGYRLAAIRHLCLASQSHFEKQFRLSDAQVQMALRQSIPHLGTQKSRLERVRAAARARAGKAGGAPKGELVLDFDALHPFSPKERNAPGQRRFELRLAKPAPS
jgi:hypothetical protein